MHNKGTCDENGVYTIQVEQATGMKILDVVADEFVDGLPYEEIVKVAENFINEIGGFERLAEWGLF